MKLKPSGKNLAILAAALWIIGLIFINVMQTSSTTVLWGSIIIMSAQVLLVIAIIVGLVHWFKSLKNQQK